MIYGKNTPHIYKYKGSWWVIRQNTTSKRHWRAAVEYVRRLNNELRNKTNEEP